MMDKDVLRKRVLALRRAMAPAEAAQKSLAILDRLFQSGLLDGVDCVLSYVSSKDNEVDTHAILRRATQEGLRVYIPKALPGRQLAWLPFRSIEELAPSRFGILEPTMVGETGGSGMTPDLQNAICLVPGIAFRPDGYRIGYGGGYYDVFLAAFSCVRVGLAFDIQMLDDFPVDAHDQKVDYVITESRTQDCRAVRL
jgi:5-formyltetrahydrofolate cyclo-ligase